RGVRHTLLQESDAPDRLLDEPAKLEAGAIAAAAARLSPRRRGARARRRGAGGTEHRRAARGQGGCRSRKSRPLRQGQLDRLGKTDPASCQRDLQTPTHLNGETEQFVVRASARGGPGTKSSAGLKPALRT